MKPEKFLKVANEFVSGADDNYETSIDCSLKSITLQITNVVTNRQINFVYNSKRGIVIFYFINFAGKPSDYTNQTRTYENISEGKIMDLCVKYLDADDISFTLNRWIQDQMHKL